MIWIIDRDGVPQCPPSQNIKRLSKATYKSEKKKRQGFTEHKPCRKESLPYAGVFPYGSFLKILIL